MPTIRARSPRHAAFLVVPLCALLAVAAWGLARSAPQQQKSAAPPVPVLVATVRQSDEDDYTSGIGNVQATASVTLRARVDGQLQTLNFREGQDVRAGDLLAQIDPRMFQAQLEQALAQKQKDEALLGNARVDLERYADLLRLDAISRQSVDTQRAQVAQLEAALRADQAQVDSARVQLGYTRITSPLSGRTGIRLVDAGNLVRAAEATGIVVVNQIDPVSVVFTLAEGQLARVNQALGKAREQPLKVVASGRENGEILGEGSLLLVNNQIDTASGTVQLKASFANREHRLWPGQFVKVRLLLGTIDDALVVPASAIQRGPNGTFVYLVGPDSKVALRPVRVERIVDGKAIVAAGLAAGDAVVAEGQGKLRPGATISDVGAAEAEKRKDASRAGQSAERRA